MYAISIHQPYAGLIASGLKTFETRTHARFRCLVGQRIAIHATKRKQQPAAVPGQPGTFYNPQRGHGIVATAVLTRMLYPLSTDRHGAAACCECDGMYGYRLIDVFRFPEPIPCNGHQSIWIVPDDVRAKMREYESC
jgi:hypothetical protein